MEQHAHERRRSRAQAGAILTLIPLLSAGVGAFQLYRDDEKREFDAITFYLQNQALFDPCLDPEQSALNLRMISDRYPRVYARIVEHVQDRSNRCDEKGPEPAPIAAEPPTAQAAAPQKSSTEAPLTSAAVVAAGAATPQTAPPATQAPPSEDSSLRFFRDRYDRLASLPAARDRYVAAGRYRVYIQIGEESERALANALGAALREQGNATSSVQLTSARTASPQLRYYLSSQAQDAERLRLALERRAAEKGSPIKIETVFIGDDYPGLPPGVMELWLP